MASSGNFAKINFEAQSLISTVTPTLGGLKFDGSTLSPGNYNGGVVCNFGMKSGKWYWEIYLSGGGTPAGSRDWSVGFAPYETCSKTTDEGTYGQDLGNGSSATLSGYSFTHVNGSATGIRHNGSTDTSAGLSDHTSGDVLGFALDLDNGTWIIYRNGSSLGTVATGIDTSLTYFAAVGASGGTVSSFDVTCNFGQDSTFGGAITAGGNADGNGFGDFKYSVPSGYLACCTGNLEISANIDPAQTDDDFPQKNFNVVTFTGNGSSNAVTGLGFQPDLIWGFTRDGSQSKRIVDSTRGGSSRLHSDTDAVANTSGVVISAFGADGFTANGGAFNNDSGRACGAWCWRANGGTTSSNSDGALTSTVQANQAAGFSISKYTSNGSDSSFGHGLGAAPEWFMIKKIDNQARNWTCWHKSLTTPTTAYIRLNLNSAQGNDTLWDSNTHDSTKIYVNNSTTEVNNPSGDSYICYAWRGIEGYSKFGKYTGNGNADGPFIYTGFRPRMVFFKRIDGSHNWITFDTATVTSNPDDEYANWDTGSASAQSASDKIDILSNGFKLRSTGSSFNNSGSTFIYGAWADVPFKYNNTF